MSPAGEEILEFSKRLERNNVGSRKTIVQCMDMGLTSTLYFCPKSCWTVGLEVAGGYIFLQNSMIC